MIRAIWIYGKPVPKGRPRFARNGGVYTPKTTADYEKRIAQAWRDKYGDERYEGNNLRIHVDVYTSKYTTSDVDNFLKIAMDGLQGVAYENDSSISAAKVIKVRVDPPGTDEGMRIAIFETTDMLPNG
jgi:Holliday junction resolvase RusA-like endonuclease